MQRGWMLKSINSELYLKFNMEKPFEIYFSTKRIRDIHQKLNLNPHVELEQVHSNAILNVDNGVFPPKSKRGDGLITSRSNVFLVVRVADCYPLYIVDPIKLVCGVFHVGWRGLKEGIVEEAVKKFVNDYGSSQETLIAVFGPGISSEYYEVGEEFQSMFKLGLIRKEGKLFFDIFIVAKEKLRRMGVKEIYSPPYDTFSNSDLFYSKRRDRELIELNRAIIGIRKNNEPVTLQEETEYSL